jgi:WD40 repeat protein
VKTLPVDPNRTRQVQELKHSSPLLGCRFDPSGRFLFAGAQDNAVVRWRLEDGTKTVLAGHKSWIRALAFAARDHLTFSGSYDGKLITWLTAAEAPTPAQTNEAHKGWLRALAISPDGNVLASCGNDRLVKLWSVAEGRLLRTLEGHESHVYNVAFHPTAPLVVSGDLKGVVKVWESTTGTVVRELDAKILHKYDPSFMADHGGVRGMAFSADGSLLACCGITNVSNAFAGVGNPLVVLFDWATGKVKQLLKPREAFQGTAWGTFIHATGFIAAAAGGNGGMLWYWKPDAPTDFFTFKLPENARDLAPHPDGRRLAVAFSDGAARVYDLGPIKKA